LHNLSAIYTVTQRTLNVLQIKYTGFLPSWHVQNYIQLLCFMNNQWV